MTWKIVLQHRSEGSKPKSAGVLGPLSGPQKLRNFCFRMPLVHFPRTKSQYQNKSSSLMNTKYGCILPRQGQRQTLHSPIVVMVVPSLSS